MTNENKLKSLIQGVPSGLLVDDAWLEREGYSPALVDGYARDGWLETPARGVYRMPCGKLKWEQVVISLQSLMRIPVAIGGLTALQMEKFSNNYVKPREMREVRLYGYDNFPQWVFNISCGVNFTFHDVRRLFPDSTPTLEPLDMHKGMGGIKNYARTTTDLTGLMQEPWEERSWPIAMSTPERAALEALDEPSDGQSVSAAETFINDGLQMCTERMNRLLGRCASAKVKKRFLSCARRHSEDWGAKIDVDVDNTRDSTKPVGAKI